MTVTVSDTFFFNGVPTNGATVRLWPITSFTTQPAQDTALPGGSSSYGPITTATTYGGAGAWAFDVEPGEYWASVQYGGKIGWGHIIGGIGADPGANQLVNGSFDNWQRGALTFNTNLQYGPDRWQLLITGGDTVSLAQSSGIVDTGSQYSASVTVVAAGATSRIQQKLEQYLALRGRTVSLSVRVKTATASVVRVSVYDSVTGSRYSSYHTGSGTWETLTVSAAVVSATATFLAVEVNFGIGTYTCQVDNAMLICGATPAAYLPLTPAEDLLRCQRYYEVQGGTASVVQYAAYGAASANQYYPIAWAVTKGGLPTTTKNGTWAVTNCSQPIATGSVNGFALSTVVVALGTFSFGPNSNDDTVTGEYNP